MGPPKRWCFTPIIFFLYSYLHASTLLAEDLIWSGFFSTGAAFTDSNVPYTTVGITKKVSFTAHTLLGLNLSKQISNEWRVAALILSHSGLADGAAKLDWAFATYEPSDVLKVTLGKQLAPVWMASAYLDVGKVFLWVLPPEEVYQVFYLRSFVGASTETAVKFGRSTLHLRTYGGDFLAEQSPSAPTDSSKTVATNMGGFTGEWTLDQTLIRAAYNRALWNLDVGTIAHFGDRRLEILTAGFKTEALGLTLLSEYVSTRDLDKYKYFRYAEEMRTKAIEAYVAGDMVAAAAYARQAQLFGFKIGGTKAYYYTLAKTFDPLTIHLTAASVKRRLVDDFSYDQKSLALGLNFDVNNDSVIKLEAKRVYLPDKSRGLFTTLADIGEAMIYRIDYSLIF